MTFRVHIAKRWALRAAAAFFLIAAATTLRASASEADAHADYVVSLGGINIASVRVGFKDEGASYAIDLGAKVSGVGSLVASGTAKAGSRGHIGGSGLSANGFNLTTKANGDTFDVAVQYASGNATGFRVDPPIINEINRVAIERKHLKGVTDPLGAFILKGAALDKSLCNRKLKLFTGMERFDIQMSFADMQTATSTRTGYQGPVVLCKLRYTPVSGHYTSSEMTTYLAESDRILIWYAPLEDSGYFIPYRVLMGTSAGDLSMVLTKLQ